MKEIRQTIASYEESIRLVHERIHQLHDAIAQQGGEGHPSTKQLARRRHLLYREMWEMQQSKQAMEEYVRLVNGREKHQSMRS